MSKVKHNLSLPVGCIDTFPRSKDRRERCMSFKNCEDCKLEHIGYEAEHKAEIDENKSDYHHSIRLSRLLGELSYLNESHCQLGTKYYNSHNHYHAYLMLTQLIFQDILAVLERSGLLDEDYKQTEEKGG